MAELDIEYLYQLAKAHDELTKSVLEHNGTVTDAHVKVLMKWVEVFDSGTVLELVERARGEDSHSDAG